MQIVHSEDISFFSKRSCVAGIDNNRNFVKYKPISIPRKVGDTAIFCIDKDNKNYTDLKSSYITVKLQIINKSDEEPYVKSATETVSCIDNLRYSLFKSAQLKLNNTIVGNPNAQTWLHRFFDIYIQPTDYRIRTTGKIFAGAEHEDDAGRLDPSYKHPIITAYLIL